MLRILLTHHHKSPKDRFPSVEGEAVAALPFLEAGHLPLILPALPLRPEDARRYVEQCDAVVAMGGWDIDPNRYGQPYRFKNVELYRHRDQDEWLLLAECVRQRKPFLGICRGFELLNVFFGGTLFQNLPAQHGDQILHMQDHRDYDHFGHAVSLDPGGFLHEWLGGQENILVNSFHNQGIQALGQGLRVAAMAPDGLVEAIEHTDLPLFGVQWHPERGLHYDENARALYHGFLQKCLGGAAPPTRSL